MTALLALTASVCWGIGDFLVGTEARRSPVLAVAIGGQAAGVVILAVLVALRDVAPPTGELLWVGIGTGIIGGALFCGIIAALAMGNMARVAPVFGLAAIVPVAVGLARGEDPATVQLIGIAVAIVGVILVSTEDAVESTRERHGNTRKALAIALVTAIGSGVMLTGLDHTAEYDPYWATLVFRTTGFLTVTALGVAAVITGRVRLRSLKANVGVLLAFGVADTIATVLWAIASTEGLLSVVAVLGGIFPAVTALLAVLVLHERLDRVQTLGVVVTITGTAMLAAGG